MSNMYDDAKFGVIHRRWFGLSKKHGGDRSNARAASGQGCFGTTDATSKTHLARWYPRGPIRVLKAGSFVQATITNASNDLIPARLTVRGGSASTGCSWNIKSTSTAVAPYTIASTTSFTVRRVKAGEYLSIKTGTPRTDKGTAANTATTTGTVAFFIDYVNAFDSSGTTHDAG
jgi:hypothetical protein